jgi:hypothetical protein
VRTLVTLEAFGALDATESFDRRDPLASRIDALPAVHPESALDALCDLGRGLSEPTARAVRDLAGRSAPPRRARLARAWSRLLRRLRG